LFIYNSINLILVRVERKSLISKTLILVRVPFVAVTFFTPRGQTGQSRGPDLDRAEEQAGRGPGATAGRSEADEPIGRPAGCFLDVLGAILTGPGRRIGQRRDATRAPTQGPRPGRAAGAAPRLPAIGPKAINPTTHSCFTVKPVEHRRSAHSL